MLNGKEAKHPVKRVLSSIGGFLAGALNGLLGAGGGMIVVPMLQKSGLKAQNAHATSVSIILPICLVSAVFYLTSGRVTFGDAAPYLLWGAVGSVLGAWILQHVKENVLRKLFGILMIWAAVRMLIR